MLWSEGSSRNRWKLAYVGFRDFLMVELEGEVGGNSRDGHNEVSVYPLAARYLPWPTRESTAVRELLAESRHRQPVRLQV